MNSRLRTAHYTLINIMYFAAFSGVHAYAAVFLLDRGFSNTSIGLLLALANVLSVILQPLVAGWIDRYGIFTNRRVSVFCAACCAAACAGLILVRGIAVVFILFALLYMLQMVYQPLIQAMYFEYTAMGDRINFGLARGLGSCGFALASAVIGSLLAQKGISVLQIANLIMFCVGILMLLTFKAPAGAKQLSRIKETEPRDVQAAGHNSFFAFVKHYPLFMLFVLAGTFLFFEHNALNDYLIQIITPLGGDETTMGSMVMVAALLELPAMAGFAALEKRIGVKKILLFSAIMFTVKTLIMLFASSVFMAYLSQICQIFAYALFIPGGAYLAEKVMEKEDKTKGQAYINCCITLGGVFSALVCGRLLDVMGVHTMLLAASVMGVIGTVISLYALRKIRV